ncbi:Hypothetical predicted protein [Pelobates cultripes]|uniref:Uncharacterized protein n=1 Tax=Pelobates cultripes TaxID=61616 RepID=A0AAD1RZB7_PELCU|nr:Hypothetical predicted protein [Pelobates cultripes]
MPYPQAARAVASWIRPETRRRQYGDPLRAFGAAIRPYKHRHTIGWETNPTDPGIHTRFHEHGKENAQHLRPASYHVATQS